MEKVKIKNLKLFEEIKEGKFGKFQNFNIQVESCSLGNDMWLNGFASYPDDKRRNWKVGDEVEVEITKNVKNNREYINFKLPNQSGYQDFKKELEELKERVKSLEDKIGGNTPKSDNDFTF